MHVLPYDDKTNTTNLDIRNKYPSGLSALQLVEISNARSEILALRQGLEDTGTAALTAVERRGVAPPCNFDIAVLQREEDDES